MPIRSYIATYENIFPVLITLVVSTLHDTMHIGKSVNSN